MTRTRRTPEIDPAPMPARRRARTAGEWGRGAVAEPIQSRRTASSRRYKTQHQNDARRHPGRSVCHEVSTRHLGSARQDESSVASNLIPVHAPVRKSSTGGAYGAPPAATLPDLGRRRTRFGLRDTRLTRVGRLRRHAITVDLLAVWVGSMVARRARRLRGLGA